MKLTGILKNKVDKAEILHTFFTRRICENVKMSINSGIE